ncbi:MAG: hypothetical protein HWE12_05145 [Oceanospirillaceae bacterium]|nr:hypothetical protein [Oceanospirillaceae bacterium]
MVNEIVANRIERAQAGLAQSVQASDGAHFRMLLSLISSNESYGYQKGAQGAFESVGQGSSNTPRYIAPEQLYSADTVERMNGGLHRAELGEVAYARAWVDTQANIARATYESVPLPDPATTLSMIA